MIANDVNIVISPVRVVSELRVGWVGHANTGHAGLDAITTRTTSRVSVEGDRTSIGINLLAPLVLLVLVNDLEGLLAVRY